MGQRHTEAGKKTKFAFVSGQQIFANLIFH